jgi:hypothetical protein
MAAGNTRGPLGGGQQNGPGVQQLQLAYAATGEPGAAGAPALGLVHSSEYLPPELMQSLAACIGVDIAVLTRDMARGTGAVVQMPLHWRLLAGRLEQQSRASGSGDIPVALLRVVMFDGRYDAASWRHRGHYSTTLPSFRNSSATWTGGVVVAAT